MCRRRPRSWAGSSPTRLSCRWRARATASANAPARRTTEAMDADGAVDAQNAPTAPWKSLRDSHKRPQPFFFLKRLKDKRISRLRASKESDDTHATYRVAAFQTFLSGRISTFGDTANG